MGKVFSKKLKKSNQQTLKTFEDTSIDAIIPSEESKNEKLTRPETFDHERLHLVDKISN